MEVKPYLKSITIERPETGLNKFPFNIPAINQLETLEFHPDVTFLIGENGSGKSTLLEAIAAVMGFGAQGGTGNFAQADTYGDSGLSKYVRARRSFQRPKDKYFLRAESFYGTANYLEELARDPDAWTNPAQVFARYGGKSLNQRSHGESFLSLIVDAFGGKGFYILDEPEAALSPQRQMAALVRINDLVRDMSQFIIATHSPILMSYPRARLLLLDDAGYREVAFEETEHFRVTRDFLNNYPKRLKNLLTDRPLLDSLEEE